MRTPLRAPVRRKRQATLLFAVTACAVGGPAVRGDIYYLKPTTASTPVDWNSAADSYFTWRDTTTNLNADLPGNAAIVFMLGAGTNGASNYTVNYNYAYTGTNGIGALYMDSGNVLNQSSSTSLMNVFGFAYVGYGAGGAQYNQSAGTTTLGGALWVGVNGPGTYNLSGNGTLNVSNPVTGTEEIGFNNTGVFNHSGGVNNAQAIVLGNTLNTSLGTYNMSNGATLNVSQNISVGDSGAGVFNMTGGTVNIATNGTLGLVLGNNPNSSGTLTISGGSLNVAASGIGVSNAGSGLLNIAGGTVNIPTNGGTLFLGYGTSTGTVNLSSGALNANGGGSGGGAGGEEVGWSGNGVFNQSNGANLTSSLYVGATYGGGNGTYTLNGGVLGVSQITYVGYYSVGVFNQNGGTANLNTFYLGGYGGTTYALNAGVLTATTENLGYFGGGTFTQNGGSHFVPSGGTVRIGFFSGYGVYNLNNGLFSLAGGVNEYIGSSQSGFGGNGTFNQSGGTHSIGGTLYVGYDTNSAGVYNLSGGLLNAQAIQINSTGVFNQTGGTLLSNYFSLNGGTITGTLQNTGTFSYASGNFAGRLINQGNVYYGGLFALANGMENDGAVAVNSGNVLVANGAGFDNLGALTLQSGGALLGSSLTNDYGGSMNAAGSITIPFTNNGSISVPTTYNLRSAGINNNGIITLSGGSISGTGTVSNTPAGTIQGNGVISTLANTGGLVNANGSGALVVTTLTANNGGGELRVANNSTLTITNPFTSSGLITVQGGNALLNGGAMTNSGTVFGVGRISNQTVNTGVIQASGGRLTFSGANTLNTAAGQIQATSGNTVSFTQGLTNAGTVALNGGTLDTGSAVLTNTGQVLGNGSLTTGGILNSGTVYLSDVNSSVYGAFTNNGSLKITANVSTFYGAVTNNGSVKTTAATARFLSAFVNNGTYVSDPSAQYFADVTVGPNGAFVGGAGDTFTLTGSLHSSSTRPDVWNTRSATLTFTGGGSSTTHDIDVGGAAGGTYANNYAWGTLELGPGQTLLLHDGDATPGGAVYTSALQLDGAPVGAGLADFIATHVQSADAADPMTVYYDPAQPANAYLAGRTYALGNGGDLAPATPAAIPEPATLTCGVLAALVLPRRRRKARKVPGPTSTGDS